MKILVTGAGGYIGSTLCSLLVTAGHDVTALDLFPHGPTLAHLVSVPHLTIVRQDVRELTNTPYIDFDCIIPLAAIVGASACDLMYYEALEVNAQAIKYMCEYLSPRQIVIIPNTNSGYGIGGSELCTELSPLKPVSHYGRTKVTAELAVMDRENSVSLRLATVFGWSPRMRRDLLVNDLTWRAYKDKSAVIFEGHFRRNFVHVRDVALAFNHVLNNWDTMKGQIYNVGDTRANMSKMGLCQKIRNHVHDFEFTEIDTHSDPDKRDYVVSNAKIEATGWKPAFTLDEGIKELLNGYQMLKKDEYGNV